MDDLLFARLQMAFSLAFHIIFAVVGIGMPLLMTIAEWRWRRKGDEAARLLTQRWAKGTAILFAVGAVSGTVLSFELGLLWPGFMEHVGGVIGLPFGLEGFAFFTEAIFLGIYLYAWERIHPWMHWLAGLIITISGAASALFIVMANGWMNAPTGFEIDPATGEWINIDPIAAMFNPAWKVQVVHMIVAAYQALAFGVAGVHAWRLLREPANRFHREALAIAMTVAVITSVAQPIVGDWAAKVVARQQPEKLAAMEGQFETRTRAPLRIGGFPSEEAEETRWAIEIPGLLSLLAFNDFDAEVKGLGAFPRDEWPPVALTHLSFQVMIACGGVMFIVSVWFVIAAIRARGLPTGKWLLRSIVVCLPLGFLAIEAGWIVTEVGRQPWVVYRVLRTADTVTPMPGLIVPMTTFTVLYLGLGVIVVVLMRRQVQSSPVITDDAKEAGDAAG